MDPLPRAAPDLTLDLLRDPYGFIGRHCDRLGTDGFRTRLALRPVACLRGPEAAAFFYDGGRFGRAGAMPPITLRLLQDKGSVQGLEGGAHRHRKAMFLALCREPGRVADLEAAFLREWDDAEARWLARGEARLLPDANRMLARAAVAWAGLDWGRLGGDRFAADLEAMVANAAGLGPRAWAALGRRRRAERAVMAELARLRAGTHPAPPDAPARAVAGHRDEEGRPLPPEAAAVEVLNLLRPILAVGRFVADAAQALEREPGLRERLRAGPALLEGFAEEVRRVARFFPLVGGRALRDLDWRGAALPEGSWVLLDLWGTGQDPRAVPDPGRFDPARPLSWRDEGHAPIPQGAGRAAETHRCPGEAITVALMAAATRRLLALDYQVGPEALASPRFRYPPSPRDGFRMTGLGRR